MGYDHLYALEKFGKAAEGLATGVGEIRERLLMAFLAFAPLQERDLPPGLRGEFIQIRAALTRVQARGNEGNAKATLDQMTDDEAQRIARQIVELSDRLEMEYQESQRDRG